MSRGTTTRCLAVWLAATAGLVAAAALGGGPAVALTRPDTWRTGFEDLLVSVCAAALLCSAARLWLVTTTTTLQVARGRVPAGAHGLTRRLVLVACGAAVVAGVTTPAMAAHGDRSLLVGLPLPDRATAGAPAHPAPRDRPTDGAVRPTAARPAPSPGSGSGSGSDEVVVRSGDSLWSLAAARLPASAPVADIDRAWREVYAANRAEIGPDPGLIRPGQRLEVPDDLGHDR